MTGYYTELELRELGFRSVGMDVLVSKKASIYNAGHMTIGNHVRIDDFTLLSGKIVLGDYIHIAPFNALYGGNVGIEMGDYSTLSSRGAVYAVTDDYSGEFMTNPTVPAEFTNVRQSRVVIGRHVIIGTNSTVLPGVTIGEGCAVGAMSLVNKSLEPWGIYFGVPCKRQKDRMKGCLKYENALRSAGLSIRGYV